MGTRAQVHIVDTGIYLYQHYDGYALPTIVRNALIRGLSRLNDDEYLTRIIFSEMIKSDIDGTTGYGIGNVQHGDIEYLITVDVGKQRITVHHMTWNGLTIQVWAYTFKQFMESTITDW